MSLAPMRSCRSHLFTTAIQSTSRRCLSSKPSTLANNPHVYVHPTSPGTSLLSLLPTTPPNASLALGSTTAIPPTSTSFTENSHFQRVLHSVLAEYATHDPIVQSQAALYASAAGGNLGALFNTNANHPSNQHKRKSSSGGASNIGSASGAGPTSAQGGMGGGGRGGWIHISDQRNPPDYGRIAWPEDIFGSVEVDGTGNFVENGRYQESGTYRMVTREGILGLSDYLREKMLEKLKELELEMKNKGV